MANEKLNVRVRIYVESLKQSSRNSSLQLVRNRYKDFHISLLISFKIITRSFVFHTYLSHVHSPFVSDRAAF